LALKEGNKQLVELLLAEEIEGFGIHWTNSEHSLSRAFLHAFIAKEGQLMLRLLDKGAGVNEVDETGRTPLIIAVQQKDLDSARMLVACGADVNVVTERENSPLTLAAKRGLLEFVELFLLVGANVDQCSIGGNLINGTTNHSNSTLSKNSEQRTLICHIEGTR